MSHAPEFTAMETEVQFRWSDLDVLGHVRHTVYYDLCASLRTRAMNALGIDIKAMQAAGVAPVLFREQCLFKRELHFGDTVRIDMELSGMRDGGARFAFVHRFWRGETLCAELEVEGAWLNLQERKLSALPEEWHSKFEGIGRSPNFRAL
ncbi:thioesterase [bacterium]|nr:thioesterase [bacterium]